MKNHPFARRRPLLIAGLILTLLVLASLFFLRRPAATAVPGGPVGSAAPYLSSQAGGAATSTPGSLEFLPGDLLTVGQIALTREIAVAGPLIAVNQAVTRARVAGELVELRVREGDAVTAGQVIGRIDNTEAVARQKERQALLASAQAQLDAALKTLTNNQNLFDRGFVSQAVVDTSTANADVARAQRDAAQAQLLVAEKQLGDTRLLAPVTGQVAERMAQPGERVAVDARIVSIVDTRTLELQASLPAADVSRVQSGQPVELTIEGLDRPRKGRVSRLAPAALGGSRSVPVFIAIEGPDAQLRPGLYARARIGAGTGTGTGSTVTAVPQSAIRDQNGRRFVYRIDADNRLVAAPVETGGTGVAGPRQETWVEITSGLSAGDRIVGPNLGALREGSTVRIRDAS